MDAALACLVEEAGLGILPRIHDAGSVYLREGSERVATRGGGAGDLLGVDAADQERVGDERAVAAPGNGFGAHDGGAALAGEGDEVVEGLLEFRGLHVVGIAAKAGIAPACV